MGAFIPIYAKAFTRREVLLLLNCDMGESFGHWVMGQDHQLMPHLHMANIACGFHASDPDVMAQTIQLAIKHQVTIGAHPGYDDKQGFGRRHIPHNVEQIKHLLSYQIGALKSLCSLYGTKLSYVKPHGALYHDMMNNIEVFEAILSVIKTLDRNIFLIIQSIPNIAKHQLLAQQYGISLKLEAFADRQYQHNGLLVPRSHTNACFSNQQKIINQVKLLTQGFVQVNNNRQIAIPADTLCIHGDNLVAVSLIKTIAKIIKHAASN